MASRDADVILSYSVSSAGITRKKSEEYARLTDLLADGYRVVDVLTTPAGGGGSSTTPGLVVVTVFMTDPEQLQSGYMYKDYRK